MGVGRLGSMGVGSWEVWELGVGRYGSWEVYKKKCSELKEEF